MILACNEYKMVGYKSDHGLSMSMKVILINGICVGLVRT